MTVVSATDIDAWQEIASKHFVPLRCTTPQQTFTSTISSASLGEGISVCRIVGTGPIRVERTERLARNDDGDDVLLSLQIGSAGTVIQHERSAHVVPGTAVLYETNSPYVLDYPYPDQDLLVLRVERSRLGLRDRMIAAACGTALDRRHPGMSAFTGYLKGLQDEGESLDAGTRQELGAAAADLLAMVLRSLAGVERMSLGSDQALLSAVKAYAREHLADPALSVEQLAHAHHVSVRKIHSLFSLAGETPAAFVRGRRLRRAAALLSSRAQGQTVASVAAACGFQDPATFNRAFTREYGCPPSKWQSDMQTP